MLAFTLQAVSALSDVVSEEPVVSEAVSSVVVSSVVVVASVVVSLDSVETEGRLVTAGFALQPAIPAVIAAINAMLITVLNFFILSPVFVNF